MKRLTIWVAALAACGDTIIDRDVCGNGVVEAGEDCDSTDDRCESCGITCNVTDDCLAYDAAGGTAGFVCGPDGFCHAPSGAFELIGEVVMPVNSYRITDVTGDGVGDVLAQSQTAVTVVFGDAAGGSLTSQSILTPSAQGQVSYGDLDTDGRLDALLPTPDGIVAYTSTFGVPAPFPFPTLVAEEMGKPLFVNPLEPQVLGIIGTEPSTNPPGLLFLVLEVQSQVPVMLGALPLCGANALAFSRRDVNVFESSPGHQMVATTLRPPGAPPELCVLSVDRRADGTYDVRPVAITPTLPPTSRPVLANLRGGPCPSLVVAQGPGPAIVEYQPINAVPCGLQSAPRFLGGPMGAEPVGAVALSPPVPNNGNVAVALTTGIYGFANGTQTLSEVYRSDRTVRDVKTVDIDGDGDLDVVATGDRDVALDILYRLDPALTLPPGQHGFLRFRLDTDAPIAEFSIGDFDGNAILDVAYVESRTLDERLLIAFGTPDQLLPGAFVGTFGRVLSLIVADLPDSTDPFNLIRDLVILFEVQRDSASSSLTFLHGSPQRTMLSFFDPREPPPDPDSTFRGVVVGKFGGPGGNDLIAVEQIKEASNLWLSLGAMGGDLQSGQMPSDASSVFGSCKSAQVPSAGKFCIEGAHFVAWPVSATADLVLGINSKRDVASFDPLTFVPGASAVIDRFPDRMIATANSTVRGVQAIALEDGTARLLVSFGADQDALEPRKVGSVNVCTFDPAAGPTCTDVSVAISELEGDTVTCVDAGYTRVAAASRFSPPDSPNADLVVLCRRGTVGDALFRVSVDQTRVSRLFELKGDAMQVGDVTGDGIDDIVVVDRNFAVPLMRIFRQCNSRDTSCGDVSAVVGTDL